jgi:hypothetical protein
MGPISPASFAVVVVLVVANFVWWLGPAIRAVASRRRFDWTMDYWFDVIFWLSFSLAILKALP